jgi:hypothetical protein
MAKKFKDTPEPRRTIPKEPAPMNGAGGVLHTTVHLMASPHEARGKVHHRGDDDVRVGNYGLTAAQSAQPYMLASKDPNNIRTTGFE